MLGFIINNKKPLKINDIAEKYNISPRTIRYDLDKIDKYLKEMGLEGLTRRPNEGVSISIKNGDIEILSKALDGINCYDYVMSQDERVHYIICELLRKDEYTTINSMANKMFVSRGTISNDLKEVKKIFEKNKIKLESIKGKGVKALGDEVKLRSIASNIMFKSSDMTSNFNINIMKMFKDIDVEFISNLIKSAENQMRNTLSDYAFNNLVIHIMISIKRIQLCKDILMDEKELKNLIKTPEFSIAAGITKMLEERYHIDIPESEIGYIAIHFLASNVMLTEEKSEDLLYIQLIVSTLVEAVEKKVKYKLIIDEQLFDGLIQHIRPMIYRLKHGINISNPLIDEIILKYKHIFDYVKDGIDFLKRDLNIDTISKEEIGYITLHFMASIERLKNRNKAKPQVLVVCATGIGTSKFLSIKLKSIFDIDILETISSHDIKKVIDNKNVDIIVSTIPVKIKNIRCVVVSTFLTEKDISELSLLFSNWKSSNTKSLSNKETYEVDSNTINTVYESKCVDQIYNSNLESKRIDLENILSIVEDNCKVEDYEKLKRELSIYLTLYNKNEKPKLKEIINCTFIKINEEADNWEDAIRKGGQILIENGCINNLYIDAMIDNVKRLGSYIVILPGIAMPHARPEDGSYKIGISIMTLKNPVYFCDCSVRVVLTLSVIDNITHMDILKNIMKIVEDSEFMNRISNAVTQKDILDIFC